MDVYQVLMKDHRVVDELFREIEKSDDREVKGESSSFQDCGKSWKITL